MTGNRPELFDVIHLKSIGSKENPDTVEKLKFHQLKYVKVLESYKNSIDEIKTFKALWDAAYKEYYHVKRFLNSNTTKPAVS